MVKRAKMILYLLILMILFILLGVKMIKLENHRKINDQDVYNKSLSGKRGIHIEVDRKTLNLIDYKTGEIIKSYTIATGKPSSPTPLGTFKITSKEKWGEGFGSRWMGLDVPWGNYGIHGTNKPGSVGFNASGGCIRMRNSDVEDIFERIKEGTTVVITNGHFGPFGYSFRALRPGDTGADVLEVQKRLKLLGFYSGNLDGIYGEGMKKSLIAYLNSINYPITDEVSGPIYEMLGIILME
ncbi:hypothetical protein E9840_07230 [Tissierella creatinini]|nr:hypothetical protein E9840_07230 [Tissierella creatinini]TJX66039.1 hypothetical protein E8P77_09105 [Soehngenia saccharolytica]